MAMALVIIDRLIKYISILMVNIGIKNGVIII